MPTGRLVMANSRGVVQVESKAGTSIQAMQFDIRIYYLKILL